MIFKRYAVPVSLTLFASVLWFVPALAQEGPLVLRPGATDGAPVAPTKPAAKPIIKPAPKPATPSRASPTKSLPSPVTSDDQADNGVDGPATANAPAPPLAAPEKPSAPAKASPPQEATKPAAAKPAIAQPTPAKPTPVKPVAAKPVPAKSNPVTVKPEPAKAAPTSPDQVKPVETSPSASAAGRVEMPVPLSAEKSAPGATQATQAKAEAPAQSAPALEQPASSAKPAPATKTGSPSDAIPAPANAATAKPAPAKSAPGKPVPAPKRGGKGAPIIIEPPAPELTQLSENILGRQSYGWVVPGRLDDHSLASDTRLLTNRVVNVVPVELVGQPRSALTETLPPPPRPIYTILGWTPAAVPIHEPGMLAFNSTEAAPLALNSLESFEAGLPAGPYRAGLIEDQEKNPERPRIELGTVMWRVIPGTGGDGVDSVAALRADVVITKMKLRAEVTIRPNRDPKVSTPLVMDVVFTGTENPITQIGMPELRSLGVDRGIPLYGTIQPKGDGFTILLASAQNDGEQNVRLLSSRSWIDIPVRLKSGSRMILAFEKGTAVRDMLRGTFRAWRLPWLP